MYKKQDGCQIAGLPEIYMQEFEYITDGQFVEVGGFNGYNWSNTHPLALAGWKGLLIEPQPLLFADCEALYKDNPNVNSLNICIGLHEGMVKLYLGGSTSTTKTETIAVYNTLSWASFTGLSEDHFIMVEQRTLDSTLEYMNVKPGFEVLVIDVEGAEVDVLRASRLEYWRPRMVIIEAHEQINDERLSHKAIEINDYLFLRDYRKIYSDYINNIYVDQRKAA